MVNLSSSQIPDKNILINKHILQNINNRCKRGQSMHAEVLALLVNQKSDKQVLGNARKVGTWSAEQRWIFKKLHGIPSEFPSFWTPPTMCPSPLSGMGGDL